MSDPVIRIGTRGSSLALAQAGLVADALERVGRSARLVVLETDGDRRAPDTAWGEGAFVAAIEGALLGGHVDVAVHSAKDVPTDEDSRLRIGAYLPRADPRDALVVRAGAEHRRLDDLPPGTRVGTDSPRRTGFLLARRPDLVVHPLHGNVDTRLRRLDAGETYALVLACAGLDRLGLGDRIAERLEPEIVPPAAGQGAIAVQARAGDVAIGSVLALIDHEPTRLAVETERSFLRTSGGGCRAPIGALAEIAGAQLHLLAGRVDPDGSNATVLRRRVPVGAGQDVAGELAVELAAPPARRVLVTRAAEQADELVAALRDVGLEPVPVPTIAIEFGPPGGELGPAVERFHTYAWVVVTSANGARAILAAEPALPSAGAPSWAAIGPATRLVLDQGGIEVALEPGQSSGAALAAALPVEAGTRVLVVRGDLAGTGLAVALRARGAEVDDVVAYRTREAPEASRALLLRASADGPIDAVLFTSGSTVRGLVGLARADRLDVTSIPAVCLGPETAAVAREAGFTVVAVAAAPEARVLATTANRALAAAAAHPKETR